MRCLVLLFKQKTAYEMRISDWSSDVCSSDLPLQCDTTSGARDERMVHPEKTRLFLVAALLALAGLTACESAAEREERLAREAYIESLDIEELKKERKSTRLNSSN